MGKRPVVILAVASASVQATPLAHFHITLPSDCKCSDQYVRPVPRVAEQPEVLPQVPLLVLEKTPTAESGLKRVSASSTVGWESLGRVA
jgi:hypothetical protein